MTQPDDGTVADHRRRHQRLTYTPDADYCNGPADPTDNFTYTLNGGSTATVRGEGELRRRRPDRRRRRGDGRRGRRRRPTIDVLANDTDPDGGPKSIDSVDPARPTAPSRITGGGTGASPTRPTPTTATTRPTRPTTSPTASTGGSTATVRGDRELRRRRPDGRRRRRDGRRGRPRRPTINVLANDTDTDGGPKAIDSVTQPDRRHRRGGRRRHRASPTSPTPTTATTADPTDNFTYSLNGGSTATVRGDRELRRRRPDGRQRHRDRRRGRRPDDDQRAGQRHRHRRRPEGDRRGHPARRRHRRGGRRRHQSLTYKPNADYCNDPPRPDRQLHLHPQRRLDGDRAR